MKQITLSILSLCLCGTIWAQGDYHLSKKIPIGGEGGWDYMTADTGGRRLYVSHATEVEVIDLDTTALIGKVTGTPGVHGIAIAPEFGRGFVSDGKADTVTIFDLKSLKKVGEAKTGRGPDTIIYDTATHRVFAYNGQSGSATVIDAATGTVTGTIDLGGRPEFSASDGEGGVYSNLEDQSLVLKIDPQKMVIIQRWPLSPGESPSSIAIDRVHRRLFIGCRDRIMVVVNADNGRVVASLPVGDHVDSAAFDPETGLIFQACGDGTVAIFHEDTPDKFHLVQTLKTQAGSKNMALDGKTHDLFLSAGEFEPPETATPDNPKPRRKVKPGTFMVLEYARQ